MCAVPLWMGDAAPRAVYALAFSVAMAIAALLALGECR
jgi:hypothetical protein